ncbi:MAG: S-layer homology domain-containing protein [Syntrophomonadaceae bacterium]|nr:S-layer homology domain-containing protein [Syntrophomonadaceae bacterium]
MLKRRKTTGLLILLTLLSFILGLPYASGLSAQEGQAVFKDLPGDDENLIFINYVAARKVMSGFPDGTFQPAQAINRAQMAAIIARLKELPLIAGADSGFTDVPAGYWAGAYIAAVSRAAYMEGFADGSFHPDETLSRAQGAAAIMRLVASEATPPALPLLDDMDAGHWAAPAAATAVAAGMISIAEDGRKFYPDKALTRGELARCLAIVLTRHPDLYGVALSGVVKPVAGEVFMLRQGQETLLSTESAAQQGDQIRTGSQASAEIFFPDGSSVLLLENCIINIIESQGRSYIKADGSPGIGVENLNIKLQQGVVFGALASSSEKEDSKEQAKQTGALEMKQENLPRLAAVNGLPFILAANEGAAPAPWWVAQRNQKVRMKIDMPGGITAVRGTFLSIILTADGKSRVACLSGDAELSAKEADGQSGTPAVLSDGKASSLGPDGNPPTPPENLSADDIAGFARVVTWIMNTAMEMDKQQEAAPPTEEEEAPEEESVLQKISNVLEDNGIKLDESLLEKIPGVSDLAPDAFANGEAEPEEYTDVAIDKSWTLIFNENIDPATILGNIYVSRDSLGIFKVPSVVQVDPKISKIVTIKPQTEWGAGQTYYIIVSNRVKSLEGNSPGDAVKLIFTTVKEEPLGSLLEQAKTMLGLGRITEAIELATAAIEQAEDDYRAYLIRGQAYLSVDPEKAEDDLDQATELNPWAAEVEALRNYFDEWLLNETETDEEEPEDKKLQLKSAY